MILMYHRDLNEHRLEDLDLILRQLNISVLCIQNQHILRLLLNIKLLLEIMLLKQPSLFLKFIPCC